jgi:aspartate racemase
MIQSDHPIIGILGGMGPQATIDFYQKILNLTPAQKDQEHLHVIINSYPQIPDRTAALLGQGPSPVPYLLEGVRVLIAAGASVIAVPCNTAHAFLPQIREETDVEILDMISEVGEHIRQHHSTPNPVGLLATAGTCATGLYQRSLESQGLPVIAPDQETLDTLVMPAIHLIKSGEHLLQAKQHLITAADRLIAQGAGVIIAGCTEIPIVLTKTDITVPLVDATTVLAQRVVDYALLYHPAAAHAHSN